MPHKKKLGTPRGVSEWRELATAGDVRRLLAWTVHSLRDGSMDRQDAMAFATLSNSLIRVIEGADIERRLADLENRYDALQYQEKD